MRVTHIITRLIIGGAQENTVASVLGLHRKPGVEIHLISGPTVGSEGSMEPELEKFPGLLTVVPELVRPIHPLKDFAALARLEKLLREQKPDIVHTHSGKAGILGRLAAQKASVPVIVHTVHGPSFGKFQGAFTNFIFRSAERHVAPITTHFIAVADAMKEQYLAAGIGRPEQHTKIFSGFSLEPFLTAKNDSALRARFGLQSDDFVIGIVARLVRLKGHDDLFAIAPELVRQNPKIKFLLVGDGEYRACFENLTRLLKLERHFVFAGLMSPSEVPRFVGIMDMLAHLSLREGLPRALPQALAAAKPVIAYDCDGAKEVCLHGRTGFLIQSGDLTNLTDKIIQLANDPALRKQFGQSGADFVRENFAVEKMVDAIYHLYQKLAAERGLRS